MWSPSGVQPHFSHLKGMYPRLRLHGWDSLWNEGKRSKRTAWYTSQGKQYSDKGSSDFKKREHAQASVEWSELKVVGPAAFVTLLCVLNYSGTYFSSPSEIQAYDFVNMWSNQTELWVGIEKGDKILSFCWNWIVAGDLRINPVHLFLVYVLIRLLQNREDSSWVQLIFLPLPTFLKKYLQYILLLWNQLLKMKQDFASWELIAHCAWSSWKTEHAAGLNLI